MPKVQWKTIRLTGFGVYGEGVEAQLGEGLNILVAPNEAGKSTLVAGLRAVLFGLSNISEEANLNTAKNSFSNVRFRSWQGAEAFFGEVTFTVDGRLYRIKRQFDTHQVTVSSQKNGRWEDTDYIHNPQAHKDSGRYLEELHKLLGLTSGEALTDTFYVEQPLPQGDELSEHVQTLLSGSGGHFLQALDELKGKLSELTRRLKNHGFKRDNNKDRQLEELEAQIELLQNRIRNGKKAAEELQAVLAARTQLAEELARVKQDLLVKGQLQEAWKEGRQHQERYLELVKKQLELRSSQTQLQALEAEIADRRREINREFELFVNAPARLPEELDRIISLEQEREALEHRNGEMEDELEDKLAQAEGIDPLLEQLQAFGRNPHLLADFREYQKLDVQYRQRCAEAEELKAAAEDCRRRLRLLPDWHRLGEDPVGELKELRTSSLRIVRFWQHLQRCRQELARLREKLDGQYFCFRQLAAAQEEALADYPVLKLKLETDYKEKERLYRQVQGEFDELAQARVQFQQEYGEWEGLDEAQLEEQLALLGQIREAREQARQSASQNSRSSKSLIVTGGMALAAAVIGLMVGELSGLLAGLVLGALLGWILNKIIFKVDQTAAKRLAELEARLGPQERPLDEAELKLLIDKLRRRRAEELRLAAQAERLRQYDLAELKAAADEARQQLNGFHQRLAEQEAVFGEELPRAYTGFKECMNRQQELEGQIERLTREELLVDSLELPGEQWPELWQRLQRLGQLWGQEFTQITEIVDWLLALDEAWWQSALNSCSEWERLCEDLEDINAKGTAVPEHYQEQLSLLQTKVAPYQTDTPLARVEEDALRYQQLREEKGGIDRLTDQLQTQLGEARAKSSDLANQIARLKDNYAVYLSQGRGDPKATKSLWQSYREKQDALDRLEDNRRVLLKGIQVTDSEELAERIIDMDNRVNYSLSRLDQLTAKHPGLPSFTQNRDYQKLEQDYRRLEEEVRGLETREAELKEKERELELTQAALEGQEPINLAQAELELAELTAEKDLIEFEAKAIGIAYHGLAEAINKYNASYRERLARQATLYFRRLTGSDREIEFEADFVIKVKEQGKKRHVIQFSQGTRDQLFLALRLAIGDLLAEEINLPFILDDPFLNYDDRRLAELRGLLRQLAEERQVFLLSHREELAAWGTPVTMVRGD